MQHQLAKMEVEAEFGSVQLNVGQGLIHSVNRAVNMWMNIHSAHRLQREPMEYYFICNNTQQLLCFGQVCVCVRVCAVH